MWLERITIFLALFLAVVLAAGRDHKPRNPATEPKLPRGAGGQFIINLGVHLPAGLTIDPKLKLQYVARGRGEQIYVCEDAAWVPKGAQATLIVEPSSQLTTAGSHARASKTISSPPEHNPQTSHGSPDSHKPEQQSCKHRRHNGKRSERDGAGFIKRDESSQAKSSPLAGWLYLDRGKALFEIHGMKIVAVAKKATPSPDPKRDVAWLQLKVIKGDFATAVYRTNTTNGQPPGNPCKTADTLKVPYAAIYSFWK